MRERHNIVGTEVGRSRPHFMRKRPRYNRRRRPSVWLWLVVALIVAGVIAASLAGL